MAAAEDAREAAARRAAPGEGENATPHATTIQKMLRALRRPVEAMAVPPKKKSIDGRGPAHCVDHFDDEDQRAPPTAKSDLTKIVILVA